MSVGNLMQSITGMCLEGFLRFWLIFLLAIETTIDHHPESMKQQTIFCLVAHLRAG